VPTGRLLKLGLPQRIGQLRKVRRQPARLVALKDACMARSLRVIPEVEPAEGLAPGILHAKAFSQLDYVPWRREWAGHQLFWHLVGRPS
jgi:hypothetical protein